MHLIRYEPKAGEKMETNITFRYKPEGKSLDDTTLSDAMSPLAAGSAVPNIGDIVTIQLASTLREFQGEQAGNFKSFQVIGRNFAYHSQDGRGSEKLIHCNICIIVTDVADNIIGVDTKS
jgi:hypothetical protein